MVGKINIRVYGIYFNDKKELMTLEETYAGTPLLKLPGGGLEYGEGLSDCLRREFQEELNLELSNLSHFYTQEDFLASKFHPTEQLLAIYYTVTIKDLAALIIKDPNIKQIKWLSLDEKNPLTLPIDRRVFNKLKTVLHRDI